MDVTQVARGRRAVVEGRLRRVREAAGLTQADIARAVGTTASAVSRWEAGRRRPRADAAERLGRILARIERALVEAGGGA